MYQVSLANTPENRQAIEELGIKFNGVHIASAKYVTVQIYLKAACFRNSECKDSPVITIEHLAPILLLNDVMLTLHYMVGNGLLDRKQMAEMAIMRSHRIETNGHNCIN